jgi:hypothetical protein
MANNSFDEFTNLYSLSKTLRFELKPVGKTLDMLEDANVFEKDKLIKDKYIKTKPFFDQLHRDFLTASLKEIKLEKLEDYLEALKAFRKDSKNKFAQDNLKNEEKRLREDICKAFSGLTISKDKVSGFLFEESVFSLLKEKYGDDRNAYIEDETTGKTISIFDAWKGFTGYFDKFQETRKNLYKADGTSTAIATRIIDQNLKRFCDNLLIFNQTIFSKRIDFSEVERNYTIILADFLKLDFYTSCLLQDGINKYNKIIGGETLPNGEKLKGINEIINKYRQDNLGDKTPFLKTLDKQILSEKETFIEGIENDEELLKVLRDFYKNTEGKIKIIKKLFSDFLGNNEKYDLEKIYISKKAFETISRKWTNETHRFEELLYNSMKEDKLSGLKYEKKEDAYKFPDFIGIVYIKIALEHIKSDINFWKEKYYINKEDKNDKGFLFNREPAWEQFLKIFEFEFFTLFERTALDKETGKEITIGYNIYKSPFENLINKENIELTPEVNVIIKNFADVILTEIYAMAGYFSVEKKRNWLTEYELDDFYTDPEIGYLQFYENAYEQIVQTYNHVRNYVTKKPWEDSKKWKLNFENSNLLTGWPDSPEGKTQYCSFIFRKKGRYFLGITDFSGLFDKKRFPDAYKVDEDFYEKMVYKQVDAKTLYGSVYKGLFGTKYSDDQMVLNDQELILRIKKILETRVKFFPEFQSFIKKIDNQEYNDAKALAREISDGSFYNISFLPVSVSYMQKGIYEISKNKNGDMVKKGLYLFEIHNKDWNLKDGEVKTGSKNLHTLYFENIFSTENIANNFPIKLNGQAEVFFRPKTKIEKLGKKKDQKGKEVIDHKRYSENKIFFHCPLTLNRGKSKSFQFNIQINNFLANNPDINIIGVDRGEKHLAYYSVIDQQGNILLDKETGERVSGSLNEVKGINYAKKLEEKAKSREESRRGWQTVEGIKDLKRGYISQVVRKLVDLAIKYNAIIVLEDLNMRFKQVRGGIEKSIYQQLEKALIEKLNFLINKGEKDAEKTGHLLKAYQLAAPFTGFKDMGKQTGIIFYTQASYTSKVDPLTGWRPNIYLKYSNAKHAKEDILKFNNISFNKEKDRMEFVYDVKNFKNQSEYPEKTEWTVASTVERFRWNKKLNNNKGGYDHYPASGEGSLTNILKNLLQEFKIDFEKNILEQIQKLDSNGNEKLFKDLIFIINLICQLRNTDKDKENDENDFIFSPVEPFFDSRHSQSFGIKLPKNGDENGSYNIARKGIIILSEKISKYYTKNGSCKNLKWNDLFISHTDWDTFVQGE